MPRINNSHREQAGRVLNLWSYNGRRADDLPMSRDDQRTTRTLMSYTFAVATLIGDVPGWELQTSFSDEALSYIAPDVVDEYVERANAAMSHCYGRDFVARSKPEATS